MKRVDLFYILNICKPISIHKLKRTPFWGNLQTSIFGKCLVLFGGFVPHGMEGEECYCLLTQYCLLVHMVKMLDASVADGDGDGICQ